MPGPLTREQASSLKDKGSLSEQTFSQMFPEETSETKTDTFSQLADEARQEREAQMEEQRRAQEAKDAESDALEIDQLKRRIKEKSTWFSDAKQARHELQPEISRLDLLQQRSASRQPEMQQASMQTADAPQPANPNVQLASDIQPTAFDQPQEIKGGPTFEAPGSSGFGLQRQAIKDAEVAGVAKATEQAAFLDQMAKESNAHAQEQAIRANDQQARLNEQMAKVKTMADDIATQKVDPNRLWANKATGDKIMAGIGLFLGAFGSGGNKAVKVIEDAIDRDIQTQKANIQSKKDAYTAQTGIYADLMNTFKDQRAADSAARQAYLETAKIKIQQIEAKYQAPELKAKSKALLGELDARIAAEQQKLMGILMPQIALAQNPDNTMAGILATVPKDLQKSAIDEAGKAQEWNRLSEDVTNTYQEVFQTSAGGVIPSMFGGSRESYQASKAKIAGAIVGKVPGIKSDSDFENIVAPMLPKPGETAEEAEKKLQTFKGFLKGNGPATPILDGFGLRPQPAGDKMRQSLGAKPLARK